MPPTPVPGDLIVTDGGATQATEGHVAVVDWTDEATGLVHVVEENGLELELTDRDDYGVRAAYASDLRFGMAGPGRGLYRVNAPDAKDKPNQLTRAGEGRTILGTVHARADTYTNANTSQGHRG